MAEQKRNRRLEAGLRAAVGRRRSLAPRARAWIARKLDAINRRFSSEQPDYLELMPPLGDRETAADVAARANWFLSKTRLPVYAEVLAPFAPDDAPHMDPELVQPPNWTKTRPLGRREVVVHRADLRGLGALLSPRHRATLVSSSFSWETDQRWFELNRRFSSPLSAGVDTTARFLSLAGQGQTAFILGTGPSAQEVDPAAVQADIRIVCNSAVLNRDLIRVLSPNVIAFTDPVFHHGPSRYAAQFRSDLRRAVEETDAVLLTGDHWSGPLRMNDPVLADRLTIVEFRDGGNWRWPNADDFSVRTTSNVLTLLMLPAAFALADDVAIAGCDGRRPDENYFWKHNAATQYSDELMRTVFAAHPAFFRDRDYADYYAQHCAELEAMIETAERAGKTVRSVTMSYIPALVARAA